MSIRPFDWRDLPALHRYRKQSVFLKQLFSSAILSSLTPAVGIFTAVGVRNGDTDDVLIGQITHTPGAQMAHLTFLAPDAALHSAALPALLDHLSSQAVGRGAFRLLADVDERTGAFEALRKASFAIYARQRVWELDEFPKSHESAPSWTLAAVSKPRAWTGAAGGAISRRAIARHGITVW